jgi:hypothetical protein
MTLPLGERPILGVSTVMGFRPRAGAAALALVTLSALFVGAGSQAALAGATVSQDGAGWRVVYRSTSKISNIVTDVAAISPGNAWAVGSTAQAGHGNTQDEPLVLHWNGGHWRRVTVPGLAGFYLTAVAASSASDVWAFAASANGGNPEAVRWDGNQWLTIPLPAGVFPDDAVVLAPADAWLVGRTQSCTGSGAAKVCPTTVYHWDGSEWSPFSVPLVIDPLSTGGISASGSRNVWVTGSSRDCLSSPCSYTPEAYHWNGSAWSKAPSMPLKHSFYEPGIAVGSRTDVWVGAWSATRARHPGRLMHWNGRRWHMVDAPRLIVTETPLVTDGHHGVWMGPWAHWTGTRWVGNGGTSALACSLVNFTRIPGQATLWGVGAISRTPTSATFDSVICALPKTP